VTPTQPGPRNEWDSLLGPLYLVPAVADWISVSATTVRRRIAARQVLGLKTSDRRWVLPSFQFNEHGAVPARLADVMNAMDPGNRDPWGNAALLHERTDMLDGWSPIEALRAGEIDRVLALASQFGQPLRELFPSPTDSRGNISAAGETVALNMEVIPAGAGPATLAFRPITHPGSPTLPVLGTLPPDHHFAAGTHMPGRQIPVRIDIPLGRKIRKDSS
jgi:hypothetical protein